MTFSQKTKAPFGNPVLVHKSKDAIISTALHIEPLNSCIVAYFCSSSGAGTSTDDDGGGCSGSGSGYGLLASFKSIFLMSFVLNRPFIFSVIEYNSGCDRSWRNMYPW